MDIETQRNPDSSDFEYDAVFIGGGGAGNIGGTYLQMQRGRALVVDQDDHLGGKCPKNACYAHHLFYDCAVQDFSRQFSGKLWWLEFDSKVAIFPIIELFMDSGRFIQMARRASWERSGRGEGS